jgi:mannose-1-phosphate guanylyltransferase/mannose-6-phosphate isomerase
MIDAQMTEQQPIVPLIMCGGAGTRLWPASRDGRPKQFLPLFGPLSSFQETMRRVSGSAFGRPIVITNDNYRFIVSDQLAEIGLEADILLEPVRRDSGPAIAAGTAFASKRDGNPAVLALAADHVVKNTPAFVSATQLAASAARQGNIVTFGVRPSRPATEYGYIRPGAARGNEIFVIEQFVEKPDETTAGRYVADGYLWNTGNFVFGANAFLAEYRRHDGKTVDAVVSSVEQAERDLGFFKLDSKTFGEAHRNSVDYAVMEKSDCTLVIPVSYDWSDVGSWNAVWELSPKDTDGNAKEGKAVFVDARNCYAASEKALVSLFGVEDIVVVATEDAILVAGRDDTAGIKKLVQKLHEIAPAVTVDHLRVHRPWGNYQSLDSAERYQVKRIVVKKGGRLSLQYHHHRAEHWIVVRGTATVTIGDRVTTLHENQSVYIPMGATHRLENHGKIDLELIEVQTGSYLGEDDIVRVEDVYRRS